MHVSFFIIIIIALAFTSSLSAELVQWSPSESDITTLLTNNTCTRDSVKLTCNWVPALFTSIGGTVPNVTSDVVLSGSIFNVILVIDFNIASAVSINSLSTGASGTVNVAAGASLTIATDASIGQDAFLSVAGSMQAGGTFNLGDRARLVVRSGGANYIGF
eukprot:TRINITY_DN17394_c0_g1_i1.p2 TRINITY_DN17394_c0_g1~~TRINITY_DN17394_c0_g1_i1.p2  ORF type:complete len:161 (+),score=19.56 TRINITY_DN17394_c0_g1_i1:144-626(+)